MIDSFEVRLCCGLAVLSDIAAELALMTMMMCWGRFLISVEFDEYLFVLSGFEFAPMQKVFCD